MEPKHIDVCLSIVMELRERVFQQCMHASLTHSRCTQEAIYVKLTSMFKIRNIRTYMQKAI